VILGSKASTYAILAVIEIARQEAEHRGHGAASIRAAEIAKHFNLPAAYAAKVMTQLVRAGILHSDRGPRGGFRLTRPADHITVLEIVEAVDGLFEVDPGMLGTAETRDALSGVCRVLEDVVAEVRGLLGQKSIAGLLQATTAPTVAAALPQLTH